MNKLTKDEQLRRFKALRQAGLITEEAYRAKEAEVTGASAAQTSSRQPMKATGPAIMTNEAIAPYRFVSLNQVIAKPERESTALNDPLPDHVCGSLDMTFEAETPLLIGQDREGVAYPLSLKNCNDGPWWIPGSSLRGMVRAAAEIVGYGRLRQTNKDYVFPLRDFEHPDYNASKTEKTGRKIGDWTQVKAGWLEFTGEADENDVPKYQIYEADLHYVKIEDFLPLPGSTIKQRSTWIELPLMEKYRALGMQRGKLVDFSVTRPFRTGLRGPQNQPMARPDAKASTQGVMVVANKSPKVNNPGKQKKLEYVFSPWDKSRPKHYVLPESWRRFEQVHTKTGRGDERDPEGSWKELQPTVSEPGRVIPVFYTGDLEKQGPDFAFGLTRLFKVPHRVKQGDMIARTPGHADPGEDMVEHLFGYVWEGEEEVALKGRLAFSGATISPNDAQVTEGPPMETVMGTPNASFAPYYLEGVARDWSATADMQAEDTRIAGRKRYVPRGDGRGNMKAALDLIRKRFEQQLLALSQSSRDKDKLKSKMHFLVGKHGRPFEFKAQIKLHNLSKAEVGLLLMAACFGGGEAIESFRHMLGRAKPFGAGQLRIKSYELKLKCNAGGQPTEADCLDALAKHMATQGIAHYPNTDEVRQFLGSCHPGIGHNLPGADGTSPIYLGLKEHASLRKRTGKLDKDTRQVASQTRSLLRVKAWEGNV